MGCYIENVILGGQVKSDIKQLIPDAGMRRRMGPIIKKSVSTAIECIGGIGKIDELDAIITATGWGCLTDSEKFLRNVIVDKEQLLNPTPFIQSTFNTIGGQIALLRHHHCYNVTYVNRSHSFEDALLDAEMRISDGESNNLLVGAFDEQTPSQHKIMERMGLFQKINDGEGVVFMHITSNKSDNSIAEIDMIDFPLRSLTEQECKSKYGSEEAIVLYNKYEFYGLFPTSSAYCIAEAIKLIQSGVNEVIVYNEYLGALPTIVKIVCVG